MVTNFSFAFTNNLNCTSGDVPDKVILRLQGSNNLAFFATILSGLPQEMKANKKPRNIEKNLIIYCK